MVNVMKGLYPVFKDGHFPHYGQKESRGGEVLLHELPWGHNKENAGMLHFPLVHALCMKQADWVISQNQSKAETLP